MIPFNKPFMTGRELAYIAQAHANGHLAGNGAFSKRCSAWLEDRIGSQKALLTHSCTAALEMAAILSGVGPGDEVIMPSFTFVSTANAFVLRGAIAGLRRHPAGHAEHRRRRRSRRRSRRARRRSSRSTTPASAATWTRSWTSPPGTTCVVIEDAAQGLLADYRDRPLGGIGHLAALSFHETKNIISGEGGALLVNDPRFVERAEIVREKGTNRSQFFRGQVDKYTWVDLGSSYLPGEIIAAFLWAQMEEAEQRSRRAAWRSGTRTTRRSPTLERTGHVRRPIVPPDRSHNAHMYYLLLPDLARRTAFIDRLKANDDPVGVPLHPAALVAVRAIGRSVASATCR